MHCVIRPTFAIPVHTIKYFCLGGFYLGFDLVQDKTTILTIDEVNPALFNPKVQFYANYIPWSKLIKFLHDGEEFNSTESLIIKSLNYFVPPNISKLFGLIDPLELLFYVNIGIVNPHTKVTADSVRATNRQFIETRLRFDSKDTRLHTRYNFSTLVQNLQTIVDNYTTDYIFYWNFK